MPEPVMITLELSSENSTLIRRCCDQPKPLTGHTTHNKNTGLWSCATYCARCKTELVVMRWKLPDSAPMPAYADPALD